MIRKKSISPRILSHSWGQLEIEGFDGVFKDVKLFPGGVREWDWGETGTRHSPGIQPADVLELVEKGSQVIVLSKGVYGRLKVMEETVNFLENKRIDVHILGTKDAVSKYNELCEGNPVGALIHSTC